MCNIEDAAHEGYLNRMAANREWDALHKEEQARRLAKAQIERKRQILERMEIKKEIAVHERRRQEYVEQQKLKPTRKERRAHLQKP